MTKPVFEPVTPEQRYALKQEIIASTHATIAKAKHKAPRDLAVAAAQSRWEIEPTASYDAVIQEVQAILRPKGHSYKDGTVRKWVTPCAPPEAKAPGRPRIHPQSR